MMNSVSDLHEDERWGYHRLWARACQFVFFYDIHNTGLWFDLPM